MEITKLSSPGERQATQQGWGAERRAISREIYLPVLKAFLLLNQSQAVSKQGWGFTRGHQSFPFASRRKNREKRHDIPEGTFYHLKQKWNPSRLGNRKGAGGTAVPRGPRAGRSQWGQVCGSDHRPTFDSISGPTNAEEGRARATT